MRCRTIFLLHFVLSRWSIKTWTSGACGGGGGVRAHQSHPLSLRAWTPHNTQKRRRRRRKERTTYGPLWRYSRLVTHPVLNPDRQGFAWVPLLNRVSRGLLRDTYFWINKTLSGRLREFKNERKVQLGNPKSGRGGGRLREQSLTRAFHFKVFKVTVQTGFHQGGPNCSWSFTRVVARRASTIYLSWYLFIKSFRI